MSLIKAIITAILIFSFFLFTALFGSLPVFRKTPVSFCHRLIWHHIPNALRLGDHYIMGGRVTRYTIGTFHYLLYEKHPVVLIFFVALQVCGEILILPPILSTLTLTHYILIPTAIIVPYYFLFVCVTTSSSIPPHPRLTTLSSDPRQTPEDLDFGPEHRQAMLAYPYDYLLFHPGYFCNTCRVPKPSRSKHCSLCKACIQKADHHCIWINNCVGRNNYLWFLLLLVSITILLSYGVYLGYTFIDAILQEQLVPPELTRGSLTTKHWRTRLDWSQTMHAYSIALILQPRVVATTLLCIMCVPLSTGFLVYHAYLLWAGMTTNESQKWADWREDIDDGLVFRARLGVLRGGSIGDFGEDIYEELAGSESDGEHVETEPRMLPPEIEPRESELDWPPKGSPGWWHYGKKERCRAKWWYLQTREGEQPKRKDGKGREVVDERWEKVLDLRKDVDNVYDLGWWGNLWEVLWHRV